MGDKSCFIKCVLKQCHSFEVCIWTFSSGSWDNGNRFITVCGLGSYGVEALLTACLIWLFPWVRRNHLESCDVATTTFIILKKFGWDKRVRSWHVFRLPNVFLLTQAVLSVLYSEKLENIMEEKGEPYLLIAFFPPSSLTFLCSMFVIHCCINHTISWRALNNIICSINHLETDATSIH